MRDRSTARLGDGRPARRAPPRRGARLALALCAAALAPSPLAAQDPATDATRRQQELRRQQLQSTQERLSTVQSDVGSLEAERERLQQRLTETARLIQHAEGRMTAHEARISELEEQEKLLRGSLALRFQDIARSLAAMQRMGRNPPPVIITPRGDVVSMWRSALLLSRLFPQLKEKADALAAEITTLERVIGEARADRQRLHAERERYNDMHVQLAALRVQRSQSLAERQKELADLRKVAGEIEKSVKDLDELISKLDEAVAKRTTLGRYQETERALAASRPAAPEAPAPAPITGAAPPLAPPAAAGRPGQREGETQLAALPKATNPAVVLAPSGSPFSGNLSRMQPAIPFQQAKAKLPMPAQGRRVISFGDRTPSGGRSNGIILETRHGATVTSPADGWIVYAGPFRSYGQILIINAGGGYHVLLAGLSQVDAQYGQFVQANEPIGTMSAAAKAKTQDNAPVLYVEFRKEGRPIDPEPWWAEGQRKVQG
jgi:septal ring factor EnvC (AmiA/AmiB activator)